MELIADLIQNFAGKSARVIQFQKSGIFCAVDLQTIRSDIRSINPNHFLTLFIGALP